MPSAVVPEPAASAASRAGDPLMEDTSVVRSYVLLEGAVRPV